MPNDLTNKVLLVPAIAKILAKTLYATVTAPVMSISPTYGTHIVNAMGRAFTEDLSPAQLQMFLPPFLGNYETYCKSKNIVPNIVEISDTGAKGFWLGDPQSAKYHMVYVHGGGYVIPGSAAHIAMLEKFIKYTNNSLAVFCVSYTLSPGAVYPTALSQCVEGLRYVLSLPNTRAATTTLAGDSAGGCLVLGVLSHVSSHPHPNSAVVKPLAVTENFKGTILIDPFISTDGDHYASFRKFAYRDSFTRATAERWLATYRGSPSSPTDEYITPAHNPASWWKDTRSGPVIVTAGEEEILHDAVVDWARKYGAGMGAAKEAVTLVIGKGETHIYPIFHPYSEAELVERGSELQESALRKHFVENFGQ